MGRYHPNIFILGITGGIGTGKSTVAGIMEEFGAVRINADEIARIFTSKGSPIQKEIQEIFGIDSFPEGSDADRKEIAKQAFSDPSKLERLNQLMHPAIRKEFDQRLESLPVGSLVAYEIPLLFETKADQLCDSTLCVYLETTDPWDRVRARGDMTYSDYEKRVQAQMDIEEKKRLSEFKVSNDTDKEELRNQLTAIYKKLKDRNPP
jgi:dephospho-CoA kinase